MSDTAESASAVSVCPLPPALSSPADDLVSTISLHYDGLMKPEMLSMGRLSAIQNMMLSFGRRKSVSLIPLIRG